ncbi:TonB-dependent receptor [bacterium]|nr:TonB-dependent receptor [bacterium]
MRRIKGVFVIAVMLSTAPFVLAQNESSDRGYYLDEITVTAPPVIEGNTVTRYAETVSTVGERQIDDLNAQDLPSALRRVPGVTISRYNLIGNYGGGDGGAVFVRGHGSGRPGAEISTMFDGIPRFSGVWAHPLMDMSSIDIAERIDIQKSVQPVMNGNMSFSSINIVPKRMVREGYTTRIHSTLGAYSTLVGELEHGGKTGDFDYYLTLSSRKSDGHRDNADGEVQTGYGRAGYTFGRGLDASFQFMYNDSWAHDPLPLNTPPLPKTQQFDNNSKLYIGTLSHQNGMFSGTVKAYYDDGYIDWREWSSTANEEDHGITTFDNSGVHIRETMRYSEAGEIVAGLDVDSYGGTYKDKRPSYTGPKTSETLTNTAPYVMVSHVFGDDIQLIPSAGVRFNMSSEFGNQAGYQFGQVVKMGKTQFHGSYARAFNLPGVWAKIMYGDFWSFAKNPEGWKKLEAEYLNHFEVGGATQVNDRLSLDVTYFHDRVTDALRVVPPPPPPPSIQNIGKYTTQGVEASANARPLKDLDTFVGVCLMNTSPDTVPNAPDLSLSAGVGYTLFGKVRLNADAQHVDKQYVQGVRSPAELARVDAYTLVNCRAGYLVPLRSYVGEIYIAFENLTDVTYEFRPGYPMPGRTFMAGLDVRI